MLLDLFTIGHSTHTIERFVKLLSEYSITAIADVRSSPYSRYSPQYNREQLKSSLKQAGIQYVFLGEQLGVRSKNPDEYLNGQVQYSLLAASPRFVQGLDRIQKGLERYRIALMCAEKDPITCHRAILVCRHMRTRIVNIKHVREDGTFETTAQIESRLLLACALPEEDLLDNRSQMIERAYDIQSQRIAFTDASRGVETEDYFEAPLEP